MENIIKCGNCGTEFDLEKNKGGCPLCGFGKGTTPTKRIFSQTEPSFDLLKKPAKSENLPEGEPKIYRESETLGLWAMFNDFFSGKAMLRISLNMLEDGRETLILQDLVDAAKEVIKNRNLTSLKGFPQSLDSDSAIGRLVHHFIQGFYDMGLFEARVEGEPDKDNLWKEDWNRIIITPTLQGRDFALLDNPVFDEGVNRQVLSPEESAWLLNYLKEIDAKGFKEYSTLKGVYAFLKEGNNGKEDLWSWFENNESFVDNIKSWSSKTGDQDAFQKQLKSLSKTFSSGKISLLRELGLVKNKRNDYSVIGEMS